MRPVLFTSAPRFGHQPQDLSLLTAEEYLKRFPQKTFTFSKASQASSRQKLAEALQINEQAFADHDWALVLYVQNRNEERTWTDRIKALKGRLEGLQVDRETLSLNGGIPILVFINAHVSTPKPVPDYSNRSISVIPPRFGNHPALPPSLAEEVIKITPTESFSAKDKATAKKQLAKALQINAQSIADFNYGLTLFVKDTAQQRQLTEQIKQTVAGIREDGNKFVLNGVPVYVTVNRHMKTPKPVQVNINPV